MKKRLTALLLVFVLLLTVLPTAALAVDPAETGTGGASAEAAASRCPFSDVLYPSSYFYRPVLWAVDNGITNGMTETTFGPYGSCTRGQVVTFLYRAAGSPTVGGSMPFTDVHTGDYYYQAVLWAVSEGITNGTSGTTFSPDRVCTRGQVVTFLYRAAGSPEVSGSNPFLDVQATDYYYDAVRWAVGSSVTNGTSETTFAPWSGCIRAQVVTFLYRIHGTEASVGRYLIFGNYEQDLNFDNGKEPIEWRVLKVDGSRALLISKYVLDAQAYDTTYASTTWETCSLRRWLNNDFYYNAFNASEHEKILTTTVTGEDNRDYGTSGGNDTQDAIFLLSINELAPLFSSYSQAMTMPDGTEYTGLPDFQGVKTAYAIAESGDYISDETGGLGWWWLRSPGSNGLYASYIDLDGSLWTDGYTVCSYAGGVRPALWLNLDTFTLE